MADTRELILTRLLTVAKVQGISATLRNELAVSDDLLPVTIVFDGDETATDADPKHRPAGAPRRVTMQPKIQIVAQGAADVVGSDLNTYRKRIIKAVLSDATLLGYTAENRSARYDGLATRFSAARATQGDMLLQFSFAYYLRPETDL